MQTAAYVKAEPHYRRAIRLSGRNNSDVPAAWREVCLALQADSHHASALVLAGELTLFDYEEIGFSGHTHRSAAELALPYFERAVAVEPLHADGWSGLARTLCELERYAEALEAARKGHAALPHGVDHLWSPKVVPYVQRELLAGEIRALFGLGRREEAAAALAWGLDVHHRHPFLEELADDLGLGET